MPKVYTLKEGFIKEHITCSIILLLKEQIASIAGIHRALAVIVLECITLIDDVKTTHSADYEDVHK